MVRAWRLYQGGLGARVLPDPGGTMQQPAIMLDAFDVMSAVERRLVKDAGDG